MLSISSQSYGAYILHPLEAFDDDFIRRCCRDIWVTSKDSPRSADSITFEKDVVTNGLWGRPPVECARHAAS
jgi:hypothetical protein